MVGYHCCCIPGCYSEVSKIKKRSKGPHSNFRHFGSPNPKFVKNDENREWAESLKRFVLSYRDPKATNILQQYHVGAVKICERHFAEEDMIVSKGTDGKVRKKLKHGALPTLNLPKKGGQLLPDPYAKHSSENKRPRKPPTERVTTPLVKHKSFSNLCSSANRITATGKSEWQIDVEEDIIKMIKADAEGHDQNQYVVWIKEDFTIGISCYSWSLPEGHFLASYDLHMNTLSSFMKLLESAQICQGVKVPNGMEDSSLINHVVTRRGDPFSSECMRNSSLGLRTKQCEVLMESTEDHCSMCSQRHKVLAAMWLERNTEKKQNGNKRPGGSFWQDQAASLAKRFKSSENLEDCVKFTATADEIGSSPTKKPAAHNSDPSFDIPSKELWMVPVQKYSELMPEDRKLFHMFWLTQMEKLYQCISNACINTAYQRNYPKELLEFWSEVWQAGKGGYRKLSASGLIAMPAPGTLKSYIKKKMENVNRSISEVLTGKSEKCLNETIERCKAELTSKPVDPQVESSNGIVEEAMEHAAISTQNLNTENAQGSTSSDPNHLQLLIVGENPGASKKVMIPVTVLRSPSANMGSTASNIQLIPVSQPVVPSMTNTNVQLASNGQTYKANSATAGVVPHATVSNSAPYNMKINPASTQVTSANPLPTNANMVLLPGPVITPGNHLPAATGVQSLHIGHSSESASICLEPGTQAGASDQSTVGTASQLQNENSVQPWESSGHAGEVPSEEFDSSMEEASDVPIQVTVEWGNEVEVESSDALPSFTEDT